MTTPAPPAAGWTREAQDALDEFEAKYGVEVVSIEHHEKRIAAERAKYADLWEAHEGQADQLRKCNEAVAAERARADAPTPLQAELEEELERLVNHVFDQADQAFVSLHHSTVRRIIKALRPT